MRVTFAEIGTHAGSSDESSVNVSESNVDSTVTVGVAAGSTVGKETQLTATVDPNSAGGTVLFKEQGEVIGSADVEAGGTATINWVPSDAGDRTVTAEFSGRDGVNPSSGTLNVAVQDAEANTVATSTTVDPISTMRVGDTVPLKATVGPNGAGGTVRFFDGNILIGTAPVGAGGIASLTWTPDASGERTIRAVFAGEGDYLASQGVTQVTVTPKVVDPTPNPDPNEPSDQASGILGSVTGSLGSLGG